jgi:hypothetical protein
VSECTPRRRYAERQQADEAAAAEVQAEALRQAAQRLSDAERESLEDPDRPRVLRPDLFPEIITVRIVTYAVPGGIIVETGPDKADQTSWELKSDDPGAAMAGAEVALAALGYTLDRFRMYQDMSLWVGRFYRKPGPYGVISDPV